ncbi:MAG: hypothetical protein HY000_14920 [Planctomycetes bacterium]|nr:hypothetical protein [Planctomycetota bacterium]
MTLKGRPIQRWTLRELLNESQRLGRELTDHLNTDYMPSVRELARLLRPHRHRKVEVTDKSIANAVDKQQKAQAYTTELTNQLEEILKAIHSHADREVR